MLLGLLSLGFWPLAPVAFILGVVGLRRAKSGSDRLSSWIGTATGLLVSVYLAITLATVLPSASRVASSSTCQDTVRVLGGQLLSWAQQHDGRLPNADTWLTDLEAAGYALSAHCPSDKRRGVRSSYAFNAALSGKRLADLKDDDSLILLFDSDVTSDNPHGALGQIAWRHTGSNSEGSAGVVCVSGRAPIPSQADLERYLEAERDQLSEGRD